jgi:hypothetical protein
LHDEQPRSHAISQQFTDMRGKGAVIGLRLYLQFPPKGASESDGYPLLANLASDKLHYSGIVAAVVSRNALSFARPRNSN